MYTFGFGSHGQLGHLPAHNTALAKPVDALTRRGVRITQVAAGSHHCLALSRDKEVFAWGQGDRGQLGTGSLDHAPLPVLLEDLLGEDICEIAAGGAHSFAYTRHFQRTDAMRVGYARVAARAEARRRGLTLEEAILAADAWGNDNNNAGGPGQEKSDGSNSGGAGDENVSTEELLERAKTAAAALRATHAAVLSSGLSMRVSESPHVNVTTRYIIFRTRASVPALRSCYADWVGACRAKDPQIIFDHLFIGTTNNNGKSNTNVSASNENSVVPDAAGFAELNPPSALHEHSLNSALATRTGPSNNNDSGNSTGGSGDGFTFIAFTCSLAADVLQDAAGPRAQTDAARANSGVITDNASGINTAQDGEDAAKHKLLLTTPCDFTPPLLFADDWDKGNNNGKSGVLVVGSITTRDNLSSGAAWALTALKHFVGKARAADGNVAGESEEWRRIVVRELKPGRR